MHPKGETLLCCYQYDALDQLVECTPSAREKTRRFYLKNRLATEIQGTSRHLIMQYEDLLLAQQHRQGGAAETHLLATEQRRSVLNQLDLTPQRTFAYTPYGYRLPENGLLSLLGFNGERADPVSGHYLLGNGYRAFNPVLMRFNSPDSWSPFGVGWVNAYAYCKGDPLNGSDPTGHFSFFPKGYDPIKGFANWLGRRPRNTRTATPTSVTNPISAANTGDSTPPVYSRSTTSLEFPPPYSANGNEAPWLSGSTSGLNRPPPAYSENNRRALNPLRQAALHQILEDHSAHLQRVEDNVRGLDPIPTTHKQTIDWLNREIDDIRIVLDLPPRYRNN